MLLLTVSLAHASAYYFLDSGTRAIGRGGAFVAGADDLTAQYYNPAALANIDRPMFNFNYWQVEQYVRFDRADESGEDAFAPVENIAPPIPEPSGGYAAPLGGIHPALKNTTAAFGLYVPTSPYMAYPADGAQRYSLIDSLIWQIYAGPSVAQRVTPWLTVGAGLQYTFLRVEQELAATICYTEDSCAEGSDDPANDITIDLKTWDWSQFSGNFGVLVQPTGWLDIGASVQPPIRYEAPGSLTASFDEEFSLAGQLDGLSFTDDDVTVVVAVPMILRAGVQVRPTETLRVEAAGTYTSWSSLDELRVTDMDLKVDGNPDGLAPDGFLVTDDIVFETGYRDSFSARLGGDYLFRPGDRKFNARVSAGVHYESSAVPPETQGVTLVDGNKWGVGLGTTVTLFDRVALDLSGAKQFLADRTITGSQLRQQALFANLANPEETSVVQGKVVGNGEFTSNLTFLAAGITVYTGKRRDEVAARPSVASDAPLAQAEPEWTAR